VTATRMTEGHLEIEAPASVPIWDVDSYDTAILPDPTEYFKELL